METHVPTVDEVMAVKPRFLALMGYHIVLTIVLRVRAPLVQTRAIASHTTLPLSYQELLILSSDR